MKYTSTLVISLVLLTSIPSAHAFGFKETNVASAVETEDLDVETVDSEEENTEDLDLEENESGTPFNSLKTSILTRIDNANQRINMAIEYVEMTSFLSEATKTIILNSLNSTQNRLLDYQNKVETTQNLAELNEVNKELIAFLQTNREQIIENTTAGVVLIAQDLVLSAEDLIDTVENAIPVLEIVCPDETETIAQLEEKLAELETYLEDLNRALENVNPVEIRGASRDVVLTARSMVEDVRRLQDQCLSKFEVSDNDNDEPPVSEEAGDDTDKAETDDEGSNETEDSAEVDVVEEETDVAEDSDTNDSDINDETGEDDINPVEVTR